MHGEPKPNKPSVDGASEHSNADGGVGVAKSQESKDQSGRGPKTVEDLPSNRSLESKGVGATDTSSAGAGGAAERPSIGWVIDDSMHDRMYSLHSSMHSNIQSSIHDSMHSNMPDGRSEWQRTKAVEHGWSAETSEC